MGIGEHLCDTQAPVLGKWQRAEDLFYICFFASLSFQFKIILQPKCHTEVALSLLAFGNGVWQQWRKQWRLETSAVGSTMVFVKTWFGPRAVCSKGRRLQDRNVRMWAHLFFEDFTTIQPRFALQRTSRLWTGKRKWAQGYGASSGRKANDFWRSKVFLKGPLWLWKDLGPLAKIRFRVWLS